MDFIVIFGLVIALLKMLDSVEAEILDFRLQASVDYLFVNVLSKRFRLQLTAHIFLQTLLHYRKTFALELLVHLSHIDRKVFGEFIAEKKVSKRLRKERNESLRIERHIQYRMKSVKPLVSNFN